MSILLVVQVLTIVGVAALLTDLIYRTNRLSRELLDAKNMRDAAVGELVKTTNQRNQLEFLLKQAPLVDAPTRTWQFVNLQTEYAYIHPATAAKIPRVLADIRREQNPKGRWITTDLMPEGGVIYSPNLMPGVKE